MSSSAAQAPVSPSAGGRGRFFCLLREFWRGLVTPDPRAVLIALGLVLLAMVVATFLAREERVVRGSPGAWLGSTGDDLVRGSVLAMQGAVRHAPGPGPTLLFLGPSALRFWLPGPEEAEQIASGAAGRPVHVLALCGNSQGLAITAALADRFGADFDGWIVIGVDRQTIGRNLSPFEHARHAGQSTYLGFSSPILREEGGFLGEAPPRETGWRLWDHWNFCYTSRLGLVPWLAGRNAAYLPHWLDVGPLDLKKVPAEIAPFSPDALDRNLAVLSRIAARVRGAGRARMALVETPWIDQFLPSVQTERWQADEAAYAARRAAWLREQPMPWIVAAERFPATAKDYIDARHVGSDEQRRRFVAAVVDELLPKEGR